MSEIEHRSGRVPSQEEFFDHCLLIADITEQSLLDSQALRDEVRRKLNQVVEQAAQGNASSLKKLQELSHQLQQMYAPDAVKRAASDAQGVVKKFDRNLSDVFAGIKLEAEAAAHSFWLRSAGAAFVVVIGLLVIVGIAMSFIPSVDEIKARRAELAALNIRIYDHAGGKWTPIRETVTRCAKNDPNDCIKFGRIL